MEHSDIHNILVQTLNNIKLIIKEVIIRDRESNSALVARMGIPVDRAATHYGLGLFTIDSRRG
jgi:hypothetical protein